MFDTLSILTYLILTSFTCLFTYFSLTINIKHLCLVFHSLPILKDFLKFQVKEKRSDEEREEG